MLDAFLYEILEVSPTARAAVIRAAYRCLVQEHHPDRHPGDANAAARMCMINHAYSVLADPLKRAQYDEKMNIRPAERRGSGLTSNPVRPGVSQGRANPRPFAFRPLE